MSAAPANSHVSEDEQLFAETTDALARPNDSRFSTVGFGLPKPTGKMALRFVAL